MPPRSETPPSTKRKSTRSWNIAAAVVVAASIAAGDPAAAAFSSASASASAFAVGRLSTNTASSTFGSHYFGPQRSSSSTSSPFDSTPLRTVRSRVVSTFRASTRITMSSSASEYASASASGSGVDEKKKTTSGRVVVVGSANQDLTAYTSQVPTTGETVMGQSFETCCGGKGANQAVAAASLAVCPVSMVCRVGPDSFGEALLSNFRKVGVHYDESSTVLPAGSSGVAPIVVDTKSGDNMIIVVPGANHELSPSDIRSAVLDIAERDGAPPSAVVVQLEIKPESALEALKAGRDVGATTILNPAPAPEGWTLAEEFYEFADIVIPNESELRRLCGVEVVEGEGGNDDEEEKLARELFDRGVKTAVIVTLGARGAMVVSKKSADDEDVTRTIVGASPDLPCNSLPVVDTVGAGDSFCGALSAYLSAGLDLADAAGKACGVASMSVRKRGAQSSYPTAEELPDELRIEGIGSEAEAEAVADKPVITFVTGNKKKLEEVQRILSDVEGFDITNRKVDLPELQGDPIDIAVEKCKLAALEVGGPVLTEDTSLCFNALNGLPGPYIKWFLDKCGHDGLNDMLKGFDDKTGYAETVVAYSSGPGEEVKVFDGRTEGKIVRPRGSLDFGWDPVFEPDEGGGKTYAEMGKEEKDTISHRGRSFGKVHDFFVAEGESIREALMAKK